MYVFQTGAREGQRDPDQGEKREVWAAAVGAPREQGIPPPKGRRNPPYPINRSNARTHTQTEHDFNLEKQMLVHNATVKINEEYAQREKNREVEERMCVPFWWLVWLVGRWV